MSVTIVVAVEADALDRWRAQLQRELPDAKLVMRAADCAQADCGSPAADYAVVWRPHPSLFAEQRNLKAVFNLGAGVDALAAMPAYPRQVPLIRLEDAGMAQPMARYVLAVALRFAHRFDHYATLQRRRHWQPKRPREPADVRVGVMGVGAIGKAIMQLLRDHGFQLRGLATSARMMDGVTVHGFETIDEFLDGLDLLVCALPLTAATAGILRRDHLLRLADGAHVVNIARGAHLVDHDLLALLANGKLSGATLDVFAHEPLPASHPFWAHDAIAITPHVAGVTVLAESARQVADKIRALERGLPVSGVVDWARGY